MESGVHGTNGFSVFAPAGLSAVAQGCAVINVVLVVDRTCEAVLDRFNRIPGIAVKGGLLTADCPSGPSGSGVVGAVADIAENVLQISTDGGETCALGGNLLVI